METRVAIRVTEDDAADGGHAFVDLGTVATSPEMRLSFRRQDAEPRHLGPGGWQPEVAWLAPLSAETAGGRTVLRYGPDVIDRIEELVPIEIVSDDGRSHGVVSWPYIQPAPPESRVLIGQDAPSTPAEPPASLLPPQAVPEPPPAPPPVVEAMTQTPINNFPPPPLPPPPLAVEPRQPAPAVARRRGSGFRWALASCIALLVAAGIVAYLNRDMILERWAGTTLPSLPRPSDWDSAQLRQEFEGLLRRQAPPQDFVTFATRALEAEQPGLAFRGYEEADPVGNEQAALQLGRFYDSAGAREIYRRVAEVNPARAAYYYALWRTRSPQAAEDLRALCQRSTDLMSANPRLRTLCAV